MQSARGPNTLNMMNYMHGEEDDQDYEEQPVSSRPNIDPKAIEDQFDNFVKEMQKYDQILSEVAKNIEEVDGQGEFITDFYPKFIWQSTYEEDQQKKIITNTDPELSKIIFNLQRSNKNLKDDMRAWVLQFAKTAKNTQILIKENKVLRQSIVLKNKEIVKLIEGIGQAQNQQITQLTENLQLLKEQNGVLKEHLLKLKEEVTQKKQEEQRIENALQKLQTQYNNLQKTKNEVQDEQQHLSKTYELIEQWRNETEKRKRRLQKQKQNLLQKKIEYEDEKGRIERQLQLCSKQKNQLETGLKKQCLDQQAEKYRLIHEITDLGDMISKQKQESRYFQDQANRNQSKKSQYEKITKQYVKKAQEGEQKLKTLQNQLQKSQQMQVAIQCQIQLQKYDVDIFKKELAELEEKQKNIHEQWKRTNKRNEESRNKEISEWQSKVIQNQRDLAMKILQEKSELSSKQKELQRWEQKVYDKKEELTDLKAQMKEIKDNQIRLSELKAKLASQESK